MRLQMCKLHILQTAKSQYQKDIIHLRPILPPNRNSLLIFNTNQLTGFHNIGTMTLHGQFTITRKESTLINFMQYLQFTL